MSWLAGDCVAAGGHSPDMANWLVESTRIGSTCHKMESHAHCCCSFYCKMFLSLLPFSRYRASCCANKWFLYILHFSCNSSVIFNMFSNILVFFWFILFIYLLLLLVLLRSNCIWHEIVFHSSFIIETNRRSFAAPPLCVVVYF